MEVGPRSAALAQFCPRWGPKHDNLTHRRPPAHATNESERDAMDRRRCPWKRPPGHFDFWTRGAPPIETLDLWPRKPLLFYLLGERALHQRQMRRCCCLPSSRPPIRAATSPRALAVTVTDAETFSSCLFVARVVNIVIDTFSRAGRGSGDSNISDNRFVHLSSLLPLLLLLVQLLLLY